jgi:hypothetical protein
MLTLVGLVVGVWLMTLLPVNNARSKGSTDVPSSGGALEYEKRVIAASQLMEIEKRKAAYLAGAALDPKWEWKQDICFYGKVEDYNGLPIGHASVHSEWSDLSKGGTSARRLSTKSDGTFSLLGVRGKRLAMRIRKDGYYPMSHVGNPLSFEYANPFEPNYLIPDPKNPVIFRLRKIGVTAALVHERSELEVSTDGVSTNVGLASGRGGERISVELWTSKPWPPRPMHPPYDWAIIVKLPSGGFLVHDQEYPFEAPETGYTEILAIEMTADRGDWQQGIEKQAFFVAGTPPRYGRLTLRTHGATRYVFLDYYLNPDGSRNLEYDPAKEIRLE